jgi:hypothetical protein
MLYGLSALDLRENCWFFAAAVRGDDYGHRLADGLFRGEAEKPLRSSVPTEDHAI